MCGITGAIWTRPQLALDEAVLERMINVLRHRGPDEAGQYCSGHRVQPPYEATPGVALGHRRLVVIDPQGGAQPMSNEDQSVWVVCNGEIYNYPALRQRLEGAGHTFRSHSDTEAIVHLYEDEGVDCFSHLNGMFAVAIWDAARRRLVLARDRLGQKPLVYRTEPGRLLFASELKSLLEVPGAPRDVDPAAVDEYFTYQYVPPPNTIFRSIRKLPPAHFAVFQNDQLTVRSYWNPHTVQQRSLPADQYVEQLREFLHSAVRMRLRSDVPLGALLSGGVDSSLIAATMQRLSDRPIKTFTIGFASSEYDESRFGRAVADHLGTEHHELQLSADATQIADRLAWHFDEPMADSSAIPTWHLSQLARQHVTVVLSGDGGDELFAGYHRYRAVALAGAVDRLPRPLRAMARSRLWQSLPASGNQRSRLRQAKRFAEAMALSPARRYLDWVGIFRESQRAELYADDFVAQLPDSDPAEFLVRAWRQSAGRDAVATASLTDLVTYLPCDLMTKVDIASMAHGLECRQPMLDHRLVELAVQIPTHLKLRGRRGKRILQRAFGSLLPDEIWRRRKMGFGAPMSDWFRSELREMTADTLLASDAHCRAFCREDAVRGMFEQHQSGQFDHAARLWALLTFELWLRRWAAL